METMESCVPPGFRFHPTEEELVGYYLKKKVASEKIDLDVIREIDLYRMEPWDLQERCQIGYEEQSDWYFFSHKDRKYPTGTRTNRATMAGFWKATGRDKAVYDKTKLMGMRKTLVFYQGRAPNGRKTDWIMHEYRLESDAMAPPQEEGWVVCRAFKKRLSGVGQSNKSMEGWDATSYFYDEQSDEVTDVVDPINHYLNSSRPSKSSNFCGHHRVMCKREATVSEAHTLSHLHPDTLVQLSQLESPSLSLTQNPNSSMSFSSPRNNNSDDDATNNEEEVVLEHINFSTKHEVDLCNREAEKVTDWRALDKFVASQLCHEEGLDGNSGRGGEYWGRVLSCEVSDAEMEKLMLLQSTDAVVEEGGSRLNALVMGSGLQGDAGICIFR